MVATCYQKDHPAGRKEAEGGGEVVLSLMPMPTTMLMTMTTVALAMLMTMCDGGYDDAIGDDEPAD